MTDRTTALKPSRRTRRIALAAVLLVAAGWRGTASATRASGFDESVSWFIARMSTSDFLHTLRYDEANMPLNYAALGVWIGLNGDSETRMRLLSASTRTSTSCWFRSPRCCHLRSGPEPQDS